MAWTDLLPPLPHLKMDSIQQEGQQILITLFACFGVTLTVLEPGVPRDAQRDRPSCQSLPGSTNSLIMRVEDLDKAMIHALK